MDRWSLPLKPPSHDPYYDDYPGTRIQKLFFDEVSDPVARWIANFKLEKWAIGPLSEEWLTIEEKHWRGHKGREITQYVGTIGADHHENRRTILFEPGAPPPPTFMVPVRRAYKPPPPPNLH